MLGRQRAGHQGHAAHRQPVGGRPAGGPGRRHDRRRGHRHRHPCADPEARDVPRPGSRRRRRAAPVRCRATGCAAGEGNHAPAPARHDRHADSADRGDDRLRRHGDGHAHRPAAPGAARSARTSSTRGSREWVARTWQRLAEEVAQGPPGLRRLPEDRRQRRRDEPDLRHVGRGRRLGRRDLGRRGEPGRHTAAAAGRARNAPAGRRVCRRGAPAAAPGPGAPAHRGAARAPRRRRQGRHYAGVRPTARSTCSSPPPSSRWASTSPTRR